MYNKEEEVVSEATIGVKDHNNIMDVEVSSSERNKEQQKFGEKELIVKGLCDAMRADSRNKTLLEQKNGLTHHM